MGDDRVNNSLPDIRVKPAEGPIPKNKVTDPNTVNTIED